jgi:hypothetical protein
LAEKVEEESERKTIEKKISTTIILAVNKIQPQQQQPQPEIAVLKAHFFYSLFFFYNFFFCFLIGFFISLSLSL